MINLYPDEIEAAEGDPFILKEIAEWHKVKAAILKDKGLYHQVEYHENREKELLREAEHRKIELLVAADRIKKEWGG